MGASVSSGSTAVSSSSLAVSVSWAVAVGKALAVDFLSVLGDWVVDSCHGVSWIVTGSDSAAEARTVPAVRPAITRAALQTAATDVRMGPGLLHIPVPG